MYKLISIIFIIIISGCSNHRILTIEKSDRILYKNQKLCYQLNKDLSKEKKIFEINFLDNKRQSSDFYIQYIPKKLISNIINILETCLSSKINIKDVNIFKKHLSDTAQWREIFYVAVDIGYQGKDYNFDNIRFKDYDTTGWVYVFKFHKPENEIITETIQRALVRIFADIEDAITNKLTLEQRNAKKDKDRLETEKLMDKYIKAQKALE